jgi:hypothetical protein
MKYKGQQFYVIIISLFIAWTANLFPQKNDSDGQKERGYFISTLTTIADPVLNALSRNELKILMPVEAKKGVEKERRQYTYLEAFGRLLSGMAPWLELGPDKTPEGKQREKYIELSLKCIHNATDPDSRDFMNFSKGDQPLVDAAFFAQALLRAPNQLWNRLDRKTKGDVIKALKSSRVIKPYESNWLFFSATVEAALLKFDGTCNLAPIDKALNKFTETWYKGDGVYGDGDSFHWDYYNSYVIQPMFLEVLNTLKECKPGSKENYSKTYDLVLKRAERYAYILESLISPEGTYPPLGRSLAYRFGVFQLLSEIALMQKLPEEIKPQEVRAALYTVIKRQINAPGTFDKNGWLQIGMVGHQPEIGERYISTGSLYLCSEVFLVLGLPADNEFWTGKDEDWISKKVWEGKNISIEHAIDK